MPETLRSSSLLATPSNTGEGGVWTGEESRGPAPLVLPRSLLVPGSPEGAGGSPCPPPNAASGGGGEGN